MFKVGDIIKIDPKQEHKVDPFWYQMWGATKDTHWKVVRIEKDYGSDPHVVCVHTAQDGKVPRFSNGEWSARASFVVPAVQQTKEEQIINKIKYLNEKYGNTNLRRGNNNVPERQPI